jgi:hypothetical protein
MQMFFVERNGIMKSTVGGDKQKYIWEFEREE